MLRTIIGIILLPVSLVAFCVGACISVAAVLVHWMIAEG